MFQVNAFSELIALKILSYNGKEYTDHPDTINDHYTTSLGIIDDKVIAVGGFETHNNEVEIFDINANTWATKTSFSFCSSSYVRYLGSLKSKGVFRIYEYGVVSRKSSVFIFGGVCDGQDSSRIVKYTLDKWEHFGNLQRARDGFRAISDVNRIYVIGGFF